MSDTLYITEGENVEDEKIPMHDSPLRALVDARQSIQRDRIRFGNRISAIERGDDVVEQSTLSILKGWSERFAELEKEADEHIRIISSDYPIINKMTQVKGVGKLLAARLVASVDISKDDTVSSLWRYCGFATQDGRSERMKKGEKLHYNRSLKPVCYLIALSFLKSKSPYSSIYYEAKEYYSNNKTEWTKLHIHYAAMRKMIKVFLSHVWQVWRELEGLSTSPPYIIGRENHTHYLRPEDFGWEV
jgi:hypothetical protein